MKNHGANISNGLNSGGQSLMDMPFESIFGSVAMDYLNMGWSIFPQSKFDNQRMPGRVNGRIIHLVEEYNLANRLPSRETMELWQAQCPNDNVACVFGPASGNVFAVDIDITNPDMAFDVRMKAEDILGKTEFIRVGMAPKIALLYRLEGGNANINTSRFFSERDKNGNIVQSQNAVEIIGKGKILTFYGRHHKTGKYFRWVGEKSPLIAPPDAVPAVSVAMIRQFLGEVNRLYPFYVAPPMAYEEAATQWFDSGTIKIPNIANISGATQWRKNQNGQISDGREAYLTHLVYRTTSGNEDVIKRAHMAGGDAIQQVKNKITTAVAEYFSKTIAQGERWTGENLKREVRSRVSRAVDKHIVKEFRSFTGEMQPIALTDGPAGESAVPFIRPRKERSRTFRGYIHPLDETTKAIPVEKNRELIAAKIKAELDNAFAGFLETVYRRQDEPEEEAEIHIIRAPTGAGKTSQCLQAIAADARTYEDFLFYEKDGTPNLGRHPFVMLLPTYNNINELRTRCQIIGLDGTLSDSRLAEEAKLLGIYGEDDVYNHLEELRRNAKGLGLRTMVYSGRVRGGCLVADKMNKLISAGLNTSSLCHAKVKVDNEKTEDGKNKYKDVYCEHYNVCPAIAQKAEINEVHLVFLSHSFMGLSIPEELSSARGIIADERIHHLFLHSAVFDVETLTTPRKPPRLKKEHVKNGLTPQDFLSDRNQAVNIALEAARAGGCPAAALFHYGCDMPGQRGRGIAGLRLVENAAYVCGSMLRIDGSIYPGMPDETLDELCRRPTGKHLREEYRFWKLLEERLTALISDAMLDEAIEALENELNGFQGAHDFDARQSLERRLASLRLAPHLAKGERDARIQLFSDSSAAGKTIEQIRISWRTEPNWKKIPTLLLDASAAPEIIAKIWQLKPSSVIINDIMSDIGKVLNIKIVSIINQTFSNSSIIGSGGNNKGVAAARNLSKIRQALSVISANFANGRIVAGTNIALREIINRDWLCPPNIDWCHFGAMRGLDMFKHHSAAVSIGRMELPVRVVDGLVAALTYDDENPEDAFDILGTGKCPDNKGALTLPMGEEIIRMRDGRKISIEIPFFPGRWGRLIQKQYREEELLQFVGRLRPVYREGTPPVWFALSSVIPDGMVVDDVIHIDDLLLGPNGTLMDAARQSGGILEPVILNHASPLSFSRGAAAFLKTMIKSGFNPKTGEISTKNAWNFHTLSWQQINSSNAGYAFVAAYIPEPEKSLSEALLCAGLGECRVNIEKPCAGELITLAQKRQPDSVDIKIHRGGAPEALETKRIEKLSLLERGETENSMFSFSSPIIMMPTKNGVFPLASEIALSYLSLKDFWKEKNHTPEKQNIIDQIQNAI